MLLRPRIANQWDPQCQAGARKELDQTPPPPHTLRAETDGSSCRVAGGCCRVEACLQRLHGRGRGLRRHTVHLQRLRGRGRTASIRRAQVFAAHLSTLLTPLVPRCFVDHLNGLIPPARRRVGIHPLGCQEARTSDRHLLRSGQQQYSAAMSPYMHANHLQPHHYRLSLPIHGRTTQH